MKTGFLTTGLNEKPVFGFPTRSDTNQAVDPEKMARGLKFQIYIEEGLYYPCRENKGAGQLHDYHEADLCLCFRICKMLVFSLRGSFNGSCRDSVATLEAL